MLKCGPRNVAAALNEEGLGDGEFDDWPESLKGRYLDELSQQIHAAVALCLLGYILWALIAADRFYGGQRDRKSSRLITASLISEDSHRCITQVALK